MATATENDQYAAEYKTLTAELSKGPKELAKLPKELREIEFLENAMMNGRIVFGRPAHWWEHKPGHAESHSERPKLLIVDEKTIEWTALDQGWHKSVYEFLEEEETLADPRLRLRIKLARRKA